MGNAARITGSLLAGLALAGLLVAQFVPFEAKTFKVAGADRTYEANPWFLHVGGSNPSDTNWYASQMNGTPGNLFIRFGSPLMAAAALAAVAVGALLILQKRHLAGVVGIVGALMAGTGTVLLTVGLDRHFKADKQLGVSLDYAPGFYLALAAVILLLAASVFAFIALTEETGTRKVRGLPARPTISVDNPQAFNPNQSGDARPFKADPEKELPGFLVTGGNREFRAESGPKKPIAGPQVTQTQKPGAEKVNPETRKAAQANPDAAARGPKQS